MLASCGKEVKIHDWPDGLQVSGIQPTAGVTFRTLSWSRRGDALLAIPAGQEPVLLREKPFRETGDDQLYFVELLADLGAGVVQSGVFPNTVDGQVTVGMATGQLTGYDVFNRTIIKNYARLPTSVEFLDYAWNDGLLAIGCKNGQIYFHDGTGIVNPALHIPYSNTISAMSFHPYMDSIIMAGSQEGSLAIWDVNTSVMTFQTQDCASIADMCMTPEEMLISITSNNKMILRDFRSKEHNTYNIGVEPTAIDYSPQREDILIGTVEGRILCFDLRRPAAIKYCFESQKNCPVRCVKYVPKGGKRKPEIDLTSMIPTNNDDSCLSMRNYLLEWAFRGSSKSEASVLSRGMDSESNDDRMRTTTIANGTPDYQIIEENSLLALKQEIVDTNKEILRGFMEDITDQFLRIRMEVSKEFCHLEQVQNQKWKEFQSHLAKLARGETQRKEKVVSNSAISDNNSASYQADSSRIDIGEEMFIYGDDSDDSDFSAEIERISEMEELLQGTEVGAQGDGDIGSIEF